MDPESDRQEDPRVIPLMRSLDQLPAVTQEVIHQHHFAGLTFQEVAEHRGETVGKIKSIYYRGIARLTQALGHENPDRPGGRAGE
ncbi:MAG: sigma-70 family RNA polymerase sigma factor [Planctomycetota bacterium]